MHLTQVTSSQFFKKLLCIIIIEMIYRKKTYLNIMV